MNRLLFPVLAQTYLSQGGHEGSFAMDALFQMRAQKVIFGKLLSLNINNLRREKAPFLDFLRSHLSKFLNDRNLGASPISAKKSWTTF